MKNMGKKMRFKNLEGLRSQISTEGNICKLEPFNLENFVNWLKELDTKPSPQQKRSLPISYFLGISKDFNKEMMEKALDLYGYEYIFNGNSEEIEEFNGKLKELGIDIKDYKQDN